MVRLSSGSADLLDSWKAIAEYLHRDVRTVQRWQRTRRFPVHRLPGGRKPGVYALKPELNSWLGTEVSPRPPSVAVLPFASLSTERDAQCFTDGLTDGIITALAQVPGLRVIARSSSFAFRDQALDVREIGSMLNAGAILEGSVQWSGNRIRVSAQLVDASSGFHLWSDLYDRPRADVFDIQDEITRSVVRGLKVTLSGEGPLVHRHSQNQQAYALWLRGRHLSLRLTPESLAESRECFRRALMLDSEYPQAWLGLADNYWQQAFLGLERPLEAVPQSREAAWRALDYDPCLGEAFAILASIQAAYDFNWQGAERTFNTALHFSPASASVHRAIALFLYEPLRRFDEALEQLEQARELDPLSAVSHFQLGRLFLFRREFDRASGFLRTALDIDPGNPQPLGVVGSIQDLDYTFDRLQRSLEERDPQIVYLPVDPNYDPIRRDPRFHRLLEAMHLPAALEACPAL